MLRVAFMIPQSGKAIQLSVHFIMLILVTFSCVYVVNMSCI